MKTEPIDNEQDPEPVKASEDPVAGPSHSKNQPMAESNPVGSKYLQTTFVDAPKTILRGPKEKV